VVILVVDAYINEISNMSLASYTWLYEGMLHKTNGQASNFTGCKDIENDMCTIILFSFVC